MTLHGLSRFELAMRTRTFLEVFSAGRLVLLHPVEAALIATRGEGAEAAIRADRTADPEICEHLDAIGVADPDALPARSEDSLCRALGPRPIVTDDHPRVERFAAGLDARDNIAGARRAFLDALGIAPDAPTASVR